MNPIEIIEKYYPEDNELRRLLIHHSRQVADKALAVADKHPELGLDREFVYNAAMLHDIGIFKTDAPGIHCHGTSPYLLHGYIGAEIMRGEGFPAIARVCERHTGTGLTPEAIKAQNLPLPPGDYTPETMAEKVVCYADKFFSKSHPDKERTAKEVEKSLLKFGSQGVEVFKKWHKAFS